MHEKEEREGKYYFKVVVLVVVGLGQALLSNHDNVMVYTFIDLFSIYIFRVSNMNRIMKDPIMKLIPFTWPVLKNHHRSSWSIPMSNKRMWLGGMVDLHSRMIGSGINTNSRKSTLGLRVSFGSRIKSLRIQFHIIFSLMKCNYPKEVVQFQNYGNRNQCWLGNWVQLW